MTRSAPTPESLARKGGKRRSRSRERGMALVLVLGTLTIMTVMLADFQDETSAELGSALATRDALRAEYAARSGINLARLLIAAEPSIRKQLAPILMLMGGGMAPPQIPVWEFADQVLGAFNDPKGAQKFASLASVDMEQGKNLGLEGAGFDVSIIDEDSKINLNSAARDALSQARISMAILGLTGSPQYDPLFSGRDGDGQYSDRQATCSALIDWVDGNQDASACDPFSGAAPNTGAEDSFYQMLDPPYYRKNAPFDSLEEVHMVRGVSDDFWQNFIDPDPDDPKKRNVTVWGQGKVNVNTANAQTLLALVCGDPLPPAKVCTDIMEQAKFLGLVHMIRTFASGAPIFSSPKGFVNTLKQQSPIGFFLKAIGLDPILFAHEGDVMKTVTAESKVFSIVSKGHVTAGQRSARTRVYAVVDFRGAPPPPDAMAILAMAGALQGANGALPQQLPTGAAGMPGTTPMGPSLTGGMPLDNDGYPALLAPSPAGRIVYFRID